jgi:ABC-type sugar transport system permease subunit
MLAAFLLPAFVLYSFFFVYPAIRAVVVSLYEWDGFRADMQYIGLLNFQHIASDPVFWDAIQRTLFISIVGGAAVFGTVFLFAGALLRPIRFKRLFRAIIFFPIVLPGIAIGVLWAFFYNYQWGPLSNALVGLGLGGLNRPFLATDSFIPAMTVAVLWTFAGYYLVLVLAGVDRIPIETLEAARLDGAGEWAVFRRIVIPMVADVLLVAVTLWIIGSLRIFDIIAATALPNPPTGSYTLSIYIWSQTVGGDPPSFRLGYGAALGVVLLLLVLVGVTVARIVGRRDAIEY